MFARLLWSGYESCDGNHLLRMFLTSGVGRKEAFAWHWMLSPAYLASCEFWRKVHAPNEIVYRKFMVYVSSNQLCSKHRITVPRHLPFRSSALVLRGTRKSSTYLKIVTIIRYFKIPLISVLQATRNISLWYGATRDPIHTSSFHKWLCLWETTVAVI